jgi:hypothetical protein
MPIIITRQGKGFPIIIIKEKVSHANHHHAPLLRQSVGLLFFCCML